MVSVTHLSASYLRLPQGRRFAIAATAPALRFASRNPAEAGLPPRIQDHPQASNQAQPTNETIFEYHGGVEDNEQEQETLGCPQPSPRQGGGTAHNPEAQHIRDPSQCESIVEPDTSAERSSDNRFRLPRRIQVCHFMTPRMMVLKSAHHVGQVATTGHCPENAVFRQFFRSVNQTDGAVEIQRQSQPDRDFCQVNVISHAMRE